MSGAVVPGSVWARTSGAPYANARGGALTLENLEVGCRERSDPARVREGEYGASEWVLAVCFKPSGSL